MKTTPTKTIGTAMSGKSFARIALITTLILLIPLVAMQFSDDWDWKLPDFIIIGSLLFGAGMTYELMASKTQSPRRRAAIGLAFVVAVAIVWAELAVGIFGTPFAGS